MIERIFILKQLTLMHIKMNDALKYYCIIIICYIPELYLFNFFQLIEFTQPEIINFLIRFIMVLLTAGLIKFFVFRNRNNFFKLYFVLSIINPILSTISLFFLFTILGISIIYAKILGDIFTSIILFIFLKVFLKK